MIMSRRRVLATLAIAGLTLTASACTVPGPAVDNAERAPITTIDSPVTPAQVAAEGDVTLEVWADAGEETTLAAYVPEFTSRYPNVQVKLTVKGFDDLIKTVINALASDQAPDVVQGNQGFATDGTMVKGGLIRPIDDIAAAYGWDQFPASAIAPFRWNDEGTVFGEGSLYGMSPVTQNVGLFYNRGLLGQAGLVAPATFAEFEAALATLKAQDIQPILVGNADKYPAVQVFGNVLGALAGAPPVMDWIGGAPGASIDTEAARTAAATMADWADKGYLGQGFNGVSADDAAAKFAGGGAAFYIAGDWNIPALLGTDQDLGFMAPPAGLNGKSAAMGSLGMGWHISAKTKYPLAATAFIAGLHEAAFAPELVDQGRVPITASTVTSDDPLLNDDIEMAQTLLDDDGIVGFLDWATDTMYAESGDRLQELLDGRITAAQFVEALQADWAKSH
jgi:raffinose/stachyose/melibiose transport system substrate-binding protein